MSAPAYAELMATSNFSFLRSGSHPEELVAAAMALGLSGVGIADRNSFAGVVRGYVAHRDARAQAPGFRYVVGVRLVFADGTPDILAYPSDRAAYGRLCRLLSQGNLRAESEKGNCHLTLADLEAAIEGQLLVLHSDETRLNRTREVLGRLAERAPGSVWLAAAPLFKGDDRARFNRLAQLAAGARVPLLAVNDVLYHEPGRKIVQDVVSCIRQHLTLETAGRRLEQNAERHLKPPAEMARLFAEHPDAVAETQVLLGRIGFSLDQLRYNYPTETVGNGETAQETLERLTWKGAARRYPKGVPEAVKRSLWSELCLIAYKGYASYFLTVEDIVRHAREKLRILCQGRGSAANSVVCYCLGVTEVDPTNVQLVFGRFLSTERDEPPDIDVDFEHERREEVMQYVYAKYGGQRTGLTATVISYRSKSAIRETAKVFGIADDTIAALNQLHWGWGNAAGPEGVKMLGIDPDDPVITQMFDVVAALKSFPRHLSQHVGGFVITRDSLESLVPIGKTGMESRTIVEWDKNDIDALGILKVDILALGMLTALRRSFELLHQHYGRDVTLAELMAEEGDEEAKAPVYRMTHRADTIGVFQIESRAQMSMLPRLKPERFYDLVIEVAIVRPGPIQGGMVHPYLKRRMGLEPVEPMPPKLHEVLKRTFGIPLFQEQAMQIAIVAAGFTPGEADKLRRAMATFRRNGTIHTLKERFISGMKANGYQAEFAERCFRQIEGFGDYGFPESHAASFALLVYASCWMKCHYPDVFACALLNSQPMGFYPPAQLVRDAIEHGVEVRGVDINHSDYPHVLEPGTPAAARVAPQHAEMRGDIWSNRAIRLGLRQVSGIKEAHANLIVARRGGGYGSIRDLWLRTGLPVETLERLAEADAFQSMGLSRREALWTVKGLRGVAGAELLPLFATGRRPSQADDALGALPPMPAGEAVVHDYRTLSLSLKGHPAGFIRAELDRRRTLCCAALIEQRDGVVVEAAGLVLVRQQPGTASGVIFMTLEDETGVANIIVWPKVFKENRQVVLGARLLAVRGQLQRQGLVTHIVARSFTDFTPQLIAMAQGHEGGALEEAERRRQTEAARAAYAALPAGRNFH